MMDDWWTWLFDYSPSIYWLLGSTAIVFIELFGSTVLPQAAVDEVSLWGKVRAKQQLNVPKRYFWHFYTIGLVWCWLCYSNLTLSQSALIVQLSRRLGECWLVETPSNSTMSLIHYVVGVTYYPMVTLSLLQAAKDTSPAAFMTVGGLLLFIVMSGWQHACHRYLASLRASTPSKRYPLPQQYGFQALACPHYTAEVGVYVSLWLLSGCHPSLALCVVFTTANLASGALKTLHWYQAHYPSCTMRYSILPGVL
eukprot:m.14892 g.14892  ORF g.14892 m.14892 type:complete len:253 (-) comp10369_c0_seq1:84-842(-)